MTERAAGGEGGEALAEALVGAWHLVAWEIRRPEGQVILPFGPGARGLLLYSPDGWMSATVFEAGRCPLEASVPRKAPLEARARAFDGFFHYAGRFHVEGDEVVHTVTTSLNPGLVGTTQRRRARLSGRGLSLSATEVLAGGLSREHHLTWTREENLA